MKSSILNKQSNKNINNNDYIKMTQLITKMNLLSNKYAVSILIEHIKNEEVCSM